jgi:plasmid stabilization system protein ParE
MSHYLLTDEAKQDLADIKRYLVREAGTSVAKSSLTKIRDAFAFLSRNPGAGHVREDLTADSLKFWSVFSYLIVYDPNTRPIQIMRVIHGSREVSAIFGQDDD